MQHILESIQSVVVVPTLLIAVWGVFGFFPRKCASEDNPALWLIYGIWLGFCALVVTLLASVLPDVYHAGGMIIAHVMTIMSVYLHFYARYKSIPVEDQKQWRPLLMAMYPDLSHWAVRISLRVTQALYRN